MIETNLSSLGESLEHPYGEGYTGERLIGGREEGAGKSKMKVI